MSFLGRFAANCRWLCSSETLDSALPAAPPPGPGLREFFLQPEPMLPPADAPPADLAAATRPTFWRWLLTPEQLPPADARQADPDPTPRAES